MVITFLDITRHHSLNRNTPLISIAIRETQTRKILWLLSGGLTPITSSPAYHPAVLSVFRSMVPESNKCCCVTLHGKDNGLWSWRILWMSWYSSISNSESLITGGNIVCKQKRRLTQGNQYKLLWHGGGGGGAPVCMYLCVTCKWLAAQ